MAFFILQQRLVSPIKSYNIQLTHLLFNLNVQRRALAYIEIFKIVQNGLKTLKKHHFI